MTYKNKNALTSILTTICLSAGAYGSTFESHIFSYEAKGVNSSTLPRLHVNLQHERWMAEDIKEQHIPFHQALFGNAEVVKGFADGQTRDPEAVKSRCLNSINDRFGKGHPHGLLVVNNKENSKPFMHAVAGGGDRAGTSEIAYAMEVDYHGKGYGREVVSAVVQECAPEVRRVGLGQNLDPLNDFDSKVIKVFQCFGGQALDQLDATASPSNTPSWRILIGLGFQAAQCDVVDLEAVASFDNKEINVKSKEEYAAIETELLKRFDPIHSDRPLVKGQRYRMIDTDGNVRTFSHHDKWNRIKYHFEKKVD
jgi:hypothetical protein